MRSVMKKRFVPFIQDDRYNDNYYFALDNPLDFRGAAVLDTKTDTVYVVFCEIGPTCISGDDGLAIKMVAETVAQHKDRL